MPITEPQVPAPVTDPDSQPYWDGLRERRIVVQRCADCDRARFPRMPSCPFCASRAWHDVESDGRGTIYSWITVRRAFEPEFAADVPYVVATVDFDDGFRMALRADDLEGVNFGARVEATFFDHADWTELRVTLDSTGT